MRIEIPVERLGASDAAWVDLLSGPDRRAERGRLTVELDAYDVHWLAPSSQQRL